jgi:GT2 family glycosyltransferase
MNGVKISIVIVTYNSSGLILDCINSIYKFADIPVDELEIIVVDNSTEEEGRKIQTLLEEHFKEKIMFIKSENLGYGCGNNIGIENSTGPIVAIMNPDVRFTCPLMKDVIKKFDDEKLGLLGYKQMGGFNYSFYIRPEFNNLFTFFFTKIINKFEIFSSHFCFLSGAFFFIDRTKFQEIGNFDKNLFMYLEEADITNRLLKAKYRIEYSSLKSYDHLIGNRTAFSENSFNQEIKSTLYYLKKFNFSRKIFLKNIKIELKLKLLIAKIIRDKSRKHKFSEMLKMVYGFSLYNDDKLI